MIIGISGKAHSGKNTIANILAAEQNFIQLSFAAPVKDIVKKIYGWNNYRMNGRFKEVVDVSKGLSPRDAMQFIGTEIGRNSISKTIWIDYLSKKIIPNKNYIITDVRFINEALFIKDNKGLLVNVTRESKESLTAAPAIHISENQLNGYNSFDFKIKNDSSILSLTNKVKDILKRINENS